MNWIEEISDKLTSINEAVVYIHTFTDSPSSNTLVQLTTYFIYSVAMYEIKPQILYIEKLVPFSFYSAVMNASAITGEG